MTNKEGQQTIHIAIIEDNEDFSDSLKLVLEELWHVNIVFSSTSIEDSINNHARALSHCDCLLLDINLPGMSGVEALEILRPLLPQHGIIIMLTLVEDQNTILAALQSGAAGYLLKTDPIFKLVHQVINAVQQDMPALSRSVYNHLTQMAGAVRKPVSPDAELTTREKEIYQGVIKGYDYKTIAAELHISTATVNFHLQNIFLKSGVRSKAELLSRHLQLTQ